jgi:hypothetical protein
MDELIKRILAHEANQFSEDELKKFDEAVLEKLAALAEESQEETDEEGEAATTEETEEEETDESEEEEVPAWASSLIERVDNLTSAVEGIQANADAEVEKEKAVIVKRILANQSNTFSEAELKAFDAKVLTKLEASLRPANYSGRGGATSLNGEDEVIVGMPMPSVIVTD